jgi:HAD superfamily hydrolase (TIGR01490 family)
MATVIRPAIRAEALALVRRHQQAGELAVIVTATNEFVTRPIARLLGIDDLIATELARDSAGRATGAIEGVPSYREGKIVRVEQWLAARGMQLDDFERSTFYSDSTNDLPLLERVSHPVATNPTLALERIALQRGWPVLRLFTK